MADGDHSSCDGAYQRLAELK